MLDQACLFCKIIRREISARIIFEDDELLAFEDINPQAPIHAIVIPKNHIEKMSDLTADDTNLAGRLVLVSRDIAKRAGIENSGYRVVINCNKDAGQAVYHLHVHLLGGRKFAWPPG